MVRGIKVSFSASLINMNFGLPNVVCKYSTLLETISRVVLNKMLQDLTVEGTTWLKESGEGNLKCSRPALKPLAKVWYHFIITLLLPTTHKETKRERRRCQRLLSNQRKS